MACAFIGAAIEYFLTPPLTIAHAITLRTSPPQGRPNTTLLGFRVALSRRAGSWPFFFPSRAPIDCVAAFPSPVPRRGRQTKRHIQAKPTSAKKNSEAATPATEQGVAAEPKKERRRGKECAWIRPFRFCEWGIGRPTDRRPQKFMER